MENYVGLCQSALVVQACTVSPKSPLQRMIAWTTDPRCLADDGRVLSWVNPEHPGFAYDEATAVFSRLHSWLGNLRWATALGGELQRIVAAQCWLMRDDTSYVFDTSLALTALNDPQPAVGRIASWLMAEKACDPVRDPQWWSQSYGAHLIKSLVPLAQFGRLNLATELSNDLVDRCFDGQRFHINEHSDRTYVHSHCYAIEGLLGLGSHDAVVRKGAEFLAEIQSECGALPAWVDGTSFHRPTDIVAQSVRIWAAVDPAKYALHIRRGIERLFALQDAETGGLYYAETSSDINSWVTAFAIQACSWARTPPSSSELQWMI